MLLSPIVLFDPSPLPIFTIPPSPFAQPLPPDAPSCDGFELVRILEADEAAIVYEARCKATDEAVSLRVLRRECAGGGEGLLAFEREARVVASVRGPNVLTMRGIAKTHDDLPCIVMERPNGTTLETLLQERGKLEPLEAVQYTLQICAALATAHAAGVVHGDLDARHTFVTRERGNVVLKVANFGRAATREENNAHNIGFTAPAGPLKYWSPEKFRADHADVRSDLWSVGVLLYRMLSGRYPFREKGQAPLTAAIVGREATSLVETMPGVDRLLASVVKNLLRRDANLRYQDVEELVAALTPFVDGTEVLDEDIMYPSVRLPETYFAQGAGA